uniref:U2 snRNP-associated SURP motif-containing protein-like n=1 Tax=Diabrotica virgifera virgifera TaxID=50390 RepID=A0A6P7F4M0_DIAVI
MSRRNYKRWRQAEEEDAAQVFKEFIETFQSSTSVANKVFVRSGVLYPDKQEKGEETAGQIYKPIPLIPTKDVETSQAIECARILKETVPTKNKKQEKSKSNLEDLKEELMLKHLARDRLKVVVNQDETYKPIENEEQMSTNLFLPDVHPKITDYDLMLEFGAYGPLASVKIYVERDGNKPNQKRGFVAFMSRKDAERALEENKNRRDLTVRWGKPVDLPTQPIYIPESLLKLYQPPPPSGLPFNAQPPAGFIKPISEMSEEEFNTLLYNSYVKVTYPMNTRERMLIHRMVEFVVKEGPEFEAMVMNKEINNPAYNFLFDNHSSAHLYYRWKVYSILHGDSLTNWSTKNFRMFKGGSIWCPPVIPCYSDGMPDQLIKKTTEQELMEDQCNKLNKLIQNLSPERSKIAEEALTNTGSTILKKIARLYLLSDVISNCKIKRVTLKVQEQEETIIEVFKNLETFRNTLGTARDQFSSRVLAVIEHWHNSNLFSDSLIQTIRSIFRSDTIQEEGDDSSIDEPLDGASLLKRYHPDMDPNIIIGDKLKAKKEKSPEKDVSMYFVPSKWDKLDSEDIENQPSLIENMFHVDFDDSKKRETTKHTVHSEDVKHSDSKNKIYPKGTEKSKNSRRRRKSRDKVNFEDVDDQSDSEKRKYVRDLKKTSKHSVKSSNKKKNKKKDKNRF